MRRQTRSGVSGSSLIGTPASASAFTTAAGTAASAPSPQPLAPYGPGPYGAKGCGEGAFAAVPAAIVNALADAGVPMTKLPLTPERVWRRIQELKEEGKWDR